MESIYGYAWTMEFPAINKNSGACHSILASATTDENAYISRKLYVINRRILNKVKGRLACKKIFGKVRNIVFGILQSSDNSQC